MRVKHIRFYRIDVECELVLKTQLDCCLSLHCTEAFKDLVEANQLAGVQSRTGQTDTL